MEIGLLLEYLNSVIFLQIWFLVRETIWVPQNPDLLGLIKSDLIGKSDPYAVLKYGDQSDKTKVIKNNLNPQWDHASDFDMDLGDNENLM